MIFCITRMELWERAERFKLQSPVHICDILLKSNFWQRSHYKSWPIFLYFKLHFNRWCSLLTRFSHFGVYHSGNVTFIRVHRGWVATGPLNTVSCQISNTACFSVVFMWYNPLHIPPFRITRAELFLRSILIILQSYPLRKWEKRFRQCQFLAYSTSSHISFNQWSSWSLATSVM